MILILIPPLLALTACGQQDTGSELLRSAPAIDPNLRPDQQSELGPSPSRETVYVTEPGGTYHLKSCEYFRVCKKAMSRAEAERRGYSPCRACLPSLIRVPTQPTPASPRPISPLPP